MLKSVGFNLASLERFSLMPLQRNNPGNVKGFFAPVIYYYDERQVESISYNEVSRNNARK